MYNHSKYNVNVHFCHFLPQLEAAVTFFVIVVCKSPFRFGRLVSAFHNRSWRSLVWCITFIIHVERNFLKLSRFSYLRALNLLTYIQIVFLLYFGQAPKHMIYFLVIWWHDFKSSTNQCLLWQNSRKHHLCKYSLNLHHSKASWIFLPLLIVCACKYTCTISYSL